MKVRFRWWMFVALVLLAAGAAAVWWRSGHGGAKDEEEENQKSAEPPVASVEVAPLHHGKIERTLTAYGTLASAPGGTRSVSFPFECRVVSVQANIGERVAAGDALLQIEPSADARLALDTARGAQDAAENSLKDVQRRFQARLATNTDLAAAESTARDARLKLDSLKSRTPGGDGSVQAPAAGVVTTIAARPGAVVPAGGPLIEIAVTNRLEARLGIAPPDAAQVKAGQAVHSAAAEARSDLPAVALNGTVRIIGQSVDPATRMVDTFVTLDDPAVGSAPILIGTFVRAEIVVETKDALLAPRASLLPKEDQPGHAVLFTIKADKAVKHEVGTGLDDGESVEITSGGDALADGASVATVGAYELEDAMSVAIGKPAKNDE